MLLSIEQLGAKARQLRQSIFKTMCNGGGGHLPTSFSMLDVLTVLYYGVLRVDPQHPKAPDRDRFILSKGHGGVALYAILADLGFFALEHLDTFGRKGTILGGHPDMHKVPGIEASTGALGHGLPFGAGVALAGKKDGKLYRVFVVIGDGECQEGSIWETALFAPSVGLDNLTVIVDYNKLQAMDHLDKIIPMEPMAEKWKAFGWAVTEVDGHDVDALSALFARLPLMSGKPSLIVAHTVKGKGISFMEDVPIWHYRPMKPDELKRAADELGLEIINGVVR
jgi:transketolase